TRRVLERAGVPRSIREDATRLVGVHERTGDDPMLRALNDADALSFFSLNSPGYLAYYGPAQTATKVLYTLARMSRGARSELAALRLPAAISTLIARFSCAS